MPKRIFEHFLSWSNCANPSNTHNVAGKCARKMIEKTRKYVAKFVGCTPGEIVFTSGSTESNCMILESALRTAPEVLKMRHHSAGKPHIIVSAIEHKSILDKCHELEGKCDITYVKCGRDGLIDPEQVSDAFKANTVLVSIMWANNETGAINNIREIHKRCQKCKIPFHTDATQAFGKFHLRTNMCDSFSASMHKLHGAKGVGLFYASKKLPFYPLISGAQQAGKRGGTENVAGIATIAPAMRFMFKCRDAKNCRLRKLCFAILNGFTDSGLRFYIIGPSNWDVRLPNTLLMCFVPDDPNKCNARLLDFLDARGITCSVGSACNTANPKASHVLYAMGIGPEYYRGIVRISLSDRNTIDECRVLVKAISKFYKG